MEKNVKTTRVETAPAVTAGTPDQSKSFAPRNLTFAENAILTAKVLGALGLLGAALWGANVLTSAN